MPGLGQQPPGLLQPGRQEAGVVGEGVRVGHPAGLHAAVAPAAEAGPVARRLVAGCVLHGPQGTAVTPAAGVERRVDVDELERLVRELGQHRRRCRPAPPRRRPSSRSITGTSSQRGRTAPSSQDLCFDGPWSSSTPPRPARRWASSGSSRWSTRPPATCPTPPASCSTGCASRSGEQPKLHKELLRNTVEVVTGVCDSVARGDGGPGRDAAAGAPGRRRARRRPVLRGHPPVRAVVDPAAHPGRTATRS